MSTTLADLSDAFAAAVAAAAAGIVELRAGRRAASAIAWQPERVLAADEAVDADDGIAVVLPGGHRAEATVVGRDPGTDLALLRVPGAALVPLALDASAAPRAGELAMLVGARDGAPLAALAMLAAVGGAWRSMRGGRVDRLLRLDRRLEPRLEGGAVIDARGRALGMAVAGPRRASLAIPAATLQRVAAELEAHGRPRRGYLGLGLQPVRLAGAQPVGVMVMSVDPDGPGAAAGVLQGDIVLACAGAAATGLDAVMRALDADAIGHELELELLRAGRPLRASLRVAQRPDQ